MRSNQKDTLLGKRITYFRNKMDWPLKTVAAKVGVSIQQMQRYEKGENKITASMLYELAKLFNVDVENFYNHLSSTADKTPQERIHNVLLIEDNADDEFLLSRALNDFSKKLVIFSIKNGRDALDFLHSIAKKNQKSLRPKPDLIFLDLHLPHIQGLDVLKYIKAEPSLQCIPVIVLSASLSTNEHISAYNMHAAGFVRKSFSYKILQSQIQDVMKYWTMVVELPKPYC